MASNPNPARVPNEIWELWEKIHAAVPSMDLGGIYAAKTGYHDVARLGDYSYSEVVNDRQGPSGKASAIDLTPAGSSDMIVYTMRLERAAKAKDPRLFIDGQPTMREFIGTKDGRYPYCYVLTGGRARGLPTDASDDWNRDSTHLWHIHISFIRKFSTSKRAMDGIASVLLGEDSEDFGGEEEDMTPEQDTRLKAIEAMLLNGTSPTGNQTVSGGKPRVALFAELADVKGMLSANAANVAQIAGKDYVDEKSIVDGTADAVMQRLGKGSDDEVLQRLAVALGPDRLKKMAELILKGPLSPGKA